MNLHSNGLEDYPILNTIISVFLVFFGEIMSILQVQGNFHIPPFIMEFFQTLAWIGAFGLFLISLYKLYKENTQQDKPKDKQ
jgi:predicted tellurium resistance membrane protein TerC